MPMKYLAQGDAEFVPVASAPGMQVAKSVTDARFTALGGGFARFRAAQLTDWFLHYDEVLLLTAGELTLEEEDSVLTLRAGDIAVIAAGSTVTYRADSADAFFVAYPGDWEARVAQAASSTQAASDLQTQVTDGRQ
jgi:ethanolamine utilization protein EutQ (cupin superfamily)